MRHGARVQLGLFPKTSRRYNGANAHTSTLLLLMPCCSTAAARTCRRAECANPAGGGGAGILACSSGPNAQLPAV